LRRSAHMGYRARGALPENRADRTEFR
jgi:hypothetical protein